MLPFLDLEVYRSLLLQNSKNQSYTDHLQLNTQSHYFILKMFSQQEKEQMLSQSCQICYTYYKVQKIDCLRPSGICYNCWHQHIKTVTSQISYKAGSEIISPFEGKDPIDICIALSSLKKDDQVDLEERLFKKYTSFTTDIEKCPSESCDFVFTLEKCKWGTRNDQKCPKCDAVLTQSNTFEFKTIIGFIYFLFFTNKCPKCEIPIQKTTGCLHMSCPCGHQFCWYCLKDYYPSIQNVYSVHEPKECASIFVSKIVFMTICLSGIFLTLLGNQIFQKFMGYIFLGVAYLLQTISLDIIIALNVFAINNLFLKRFNHGYNSNYNKPIFFGIISLDLIAILVLWWFDLLLNSALIIVAQLAIVGIGALIVWLVIWTADTWFKFIC